MATPKIFLGSSTESLGIAKALQENLEMGSRTECVIWNQGVFELSKGTLDNLIDLLKKYDFAVFVFSADDIVKMREKVYAATRDNVIFETGLAMGVLGKERTFFIKPKAKDVDIHLPTDLLGITFPEFDQNRFDRGDEIPALAVVANRILREIEKAENTREKWYEGLSIDVADVPRIFEQTGLTHAYQTRLEALSKMLDDIQNAKKSVSMYSRVYLSNLIKSPNFSDALFAAVSSKSLANTNFFVKNISTDPKDAKLVNQLYLFEDPSKGRWRSSSEYMHHLEGGASLFNEKYDDLRTKLLLVGKAQRARVVFEQNYLVNYLLPYSLLIIDEMIIYVSFYSLSSKRYGEFAPTMRLVYKSGDPENRWAYRFLQERKNIDKNYLKKGYKKPAI